MATRRLIVLMFAGFALAGLGISAHDQYRFVGTVVKLEVDKPRPPLALLTIDTKVDNEAVTVKMLMSDKTPLERDGKPVALSALKPGVYVVVDALVDGLDDVEAEAIRIVPAPTSTPAR